LVHLPLSRTIKSTVTNWKARNHLLSLLAREQWLFSPTRINMILTETKEWEAYYLPISVNGLRVLDVGAGEGETARFFLQHGASEIVCIEQDKPSWEILKRNAEHHPLTCLNKRFDLKDLEIPHDFMKIDIEGYEELLLQARLKEPSVIEVHGLQLRDKFQSQGYAIEYPFKSEISPVCYAYLKKPQ